MTEEKKEDKAKKKKKPTALKRNIQDEKKYARNRSWKRRIHTARVQFKELSSQDEKSSKLNQLFSLLDKAAKNKVMKKGTVARLKSRYHAKMKSA